MADLCGVKGQKGGGNVLAAQGESAQGKSAQGNVLAAQGKSAQGEGADRRGGGECPSGVEQIQKPPSRKHQFNGVLMCCEAWPAVSMQAAYLMIKAAPGSLASVAELAA